MECLGNEKKIYHEKYIEWLEGVSFYVKPIGIYAGFSFCILHKCLVCNKEWFCSPQDLLEGNSVCCHKPHSGHKPVMKKSKYPELKGLSKEDKYTEKLRTKHPNIRLTGAYEGSVIACEHTCVICGNVWSAIPSNLFSYGMGCIKCAGKSHGLKQITHEEYVKKLAGTHPTIKVTEEYKGCRTAIEHKCELCGKTWKTKPSWIKHKC